MRRSTVLVLFAASLVGCAGDEVGMQIGERGGVVASEDGRLYLEVPAHSLQSETSISIQESDACEDGAIACYAFEPWGLVLQAPANVVFEDAGMGADAFTLHVQGPDGWGSMADASYDLDEGEAWGSVVYLTSVAITDDESR